MAVGVARQAGLLPSPPQEPAWVPMIPGQRHPEAIPTTEAEIRGERAVAWRPGVGAILFDPTP
jgi:hypothetical protein